MRRAAVALLVTAFLAAGCSLGDDEADGDGRGSGTQAAEAVVGGEGAPPPTVPDIVRRIEPSVVAVIVDEGEGSGVIWDESGLIVTNEHVVRKTKEVQILFASGRRVEARVRAVDPLADIALVEVERKGLPAAEFERKTPRVGELVVAVGNPFGFENTVSAGIVSGVHRVLPAEGPKTPALVDLIQTDAAISPGNSGGVLVNQQGKVVGLNVAYIPPQQGAVEVGFAIPTRVVTEVVRELLEDGEAEHAYLGVQPTELWPELLQRFGIEASAGVLVVNASPTSPAGRAGVERGDVILSVDGQPTRTVDDFLVNVSERSPGERVTLEILRNDRKRRVTATLTDRPE